VRARGVSRAARQGRRYFRMAAAGFSASMVTIILLNALVWQRARHPAPLFLHATPVVRKKEPRIAVTIASPAPLPQPPVPPVEMRGRPTERPQGQKTLPEEPLLEKLLRKKPAREHSRHSRAAPSAARQQNGISRLLKAPRPPRARSAKAAKASPAVPSKSVLAAQRALVKLGFVLRPDGVAGATTRRAIEDYERDNGLPIRGELNAALMRRLSIESGITGAR
jgi:hypothetical protein